MTISNKVQAARKRPSVTISAASIDYSGTSASSESASATSSEPSARSSTKTTAESESETDEPDSGTLNEIMKLAKRFSFTCELFMDNFELFRNPCPITMAIISSPDRYNSKDSVKDGIVAELYSLVPGRLHDLMQNDSAFGKTVIVYNHDWSQLIAFSLFKLLGMGSLTRSNECAMSFLNYFPLCKMRPLFSSALRLNLARIIPYSARCSCSRVIQHIKPFARFYIPVVRKFQQRFSKIKSFLS
jgi:hypothetical protein